jgi:NADH dehydrogenase/NADH:ubiquinone oxidoreductase subunit G
MSLVTVTIDNRQVQVEAGTTILEAAKRLGIKIPTLCAWAEIGHAPGACRVCLTEVEGQRSLTAACSFPVTEGMVVRTNTERVRIARRYLYYRPPVGRRPLPKHRPYLPPDPEDQG